MKNEQAGEAVGQLMPQESSGTGRNVSLRWWHGVAVASLVKLRLDVESDDDLAELTETFGEDQAQVLEYVEILRGMGLTREQTAALDEFERRWAVATADARAVIDAETVNDEVRAKARAFWNDLDDIDDLIDDKLEEMRERHGADW